MSEVNIEYNFQNLKTLVQKHIKGFLMNFKTIITL